MTLPRTDQINEGALDYLPGWSPRIFADSTVLVQKGVGSLVVYSL